MAGAIAGCTSRMVIAPLDVIKIRYQVQVASNGPYRGIFQSILHVIKNEGYFVGIILTVFACNLKSF